MVDALGPIPDWDPSGLLPPFIGAPASGGQRSPYQVGLTDLVLRYSDTASRRILLNGLMDFRAALHTVGLRQGFQWVNGSFIEHTMHRSQQEPRDIDIVTFFSLPDTLEEPQLMKDYPLLFNPPANKQRYGVDSYFVGLDSTDISYLVRRIVYWYGLWSHDRTNQWKGYLQIDLSDIEEATARAALDEADAREEGK